MNPFNYRLTRAHNKLDEEIRSEQKRRAPDPWRLLRLKKLRLVIKDRMQRLIAKRQKGVT